MKGNISRSEWRVFQKKRMADTVLFTAALRHIMAVTLQSRQNFDMQQSQK